MADPRPGHSTTITFGTSGWTPEVVSMGELGEALEVIDTTHLATSGTRTYMSGIIKTPKQFTLTVQFDQADLPVITGTAETITITFPTAKTLSFSGFVFDRTVPSVESNGLMQMNVSIQPSGTMTWSA